MSNSYTEDHLVEQPAIQFIRNELGWEVVNCHGEWDGAGSALGRDGKREVMLVSRLRPALQRLNPDLPVEAIEGAVEEMGILNDGSVVAFGFAGTSSWILNGRGRRQAVPRLNPNSGGGGGLSALVDGFQYFWRFHRLVKLTFLLKPHSIFTESEVSRMRE